MTTKKSDQFPESPARADDVVDVGDESRGGASCTIVGVGASAGGLEAFTQLLKHLPLDTGMGFVLVQHLDPEHESALAQILSRATSLPVNDVTDNEPVQANHVYVIPRDTNLSIDQGVLKLTPRQRTRAPHRPIDSFFESLAQDLRDRAIGVVLSGTASDGTLGLEAIKAEGGITFAQDDSAKHDSMPRSAVAAGCVDLVLSPAEIAKELERIAKHPTVVANDEWRLASEDLSSEVGVASDSALTTRHSPLTTPEDDRAEATAHEGDDTPLPSGGSPGEESTPGKKTRRRGKQPRAETEGGNDTDGETGAENGHKRILLLLRNHSGVDFSLYKSTTIQRRINRRMILTKHETPSDYAAFLKGNAKELDSLYSDVLISVTSFFRNPEMFDSLERTVLPKLLEQRGDDPLRCWVLGCSTGQEAYSIAMSFVEAAEKAPRMRKLQIFATDLNEALLDKARHGLYAKTLANDISPVRLRRFFVEEDGGYRINKALREMVVFARQNLIADPPFSRMDIISCRNLLIYLEPTLQQKALPAFHYALKPGGFLLLGASESIGGFTDLFEPVDKKYKIYSRKPAPTPAFHLPMKKSDEWRVASGEKNENAARPYSSLATDHSPLAGELNAQREADRITVNQFAPPGVLVNDELQVLQFRGPTGAYLEPPAGKASFDVLKMAREGLMLPLRAAINQARKENKTARKENVRFKRDGQSRTVHLEVIPLKNLRERCFLILFTEANETGSAPRRARRPVKRFTLPISKEEEPARIAELETELSEMREYLQSLQEQHEAGHEELQAANEEVQSANEELQSVNEELETSKEELESANEELTTVNEEMSNRNVELNRLNTDLVNFQASTKLAVVLVGRALTIRRFSPQAEKQFGLLATDVGRPIGHIRHGLEKSGEGRGASDEKVESSLTTHHPPLTTPVNLESIAAEVIAGVREQECEVRDRAGWYVLRVRPYVTLDNKVDGAVLVLVDVDTIKRNELAAVAAARDYAENMIATVREPLLVLDKELRIESANRSFYRVFHVTVKETVGKHLFELGNRQWDIPRLRELLDEVLQQSTTIEDFPVEHDFESIGKKFMLLNARRIVDPQRTTERILLAIEDITERKRSEAANARLAAIVESSDAAIISKDLNSVIMTWNRGAQRLFGYSAEEIIGKPVMTLIPEDHIDEDPLILARIRRGESIDNYETVRRRKDGSLVEVSLTVSPIKDASGNVVGASNVARDITERLGVQRALEEHERQRALIGVITDVPWTTDAQGQFVTPQPAYARYTGKTWEELRGSGWLQCIHPDDREELARIWKHAVETRTTYNAPCREWHGPSQQWRHIIARGTPVLHADGPDKGKVREWVGSLTDVHEQRVAEESLREREHFVSSLLDSIGDAFMSLDKEWRFTFVNDQAIARFDMGARANVVGKNVWELFPDAVGNEAHMQLHRAMHDRVGVEYEVFYEPWKKWFFDKAFPTPDGGVSILSRDITERKRGEAANARLAAIVESSEDAIISKDLNSVITTWNKGAEHLFGYTAAEAVGQSVTMLVPTDHLDEELEILARIKGGEVIVHYETVRRRKDGSLIDVSLTVSPIRDGQGKVIGASNITRDVSERRQAERKIAEQSEIIANESRRKDEFLAMLSHELRNPIAPIRSAVNLLRLTEQGSENPIQKQAHDIIERQVGNLTKLVNDLLEVSRVISGRIRLNLRTVDLNQIVQQAMETVKPLVEQRQHELVLNLNPEPVWVNADATRVEEVFINLLDNAIKYTPDGGHIEVVVSGEWRVASDEKKQLSGDFLAPRPSPLATIRVRDNGTGIDRELMPRIFDLFTQADRSLARSAGGLGIGLSLAHRLVELHGGTIEAHSPPEGSDVGSEFIVKLPLSVAPPELRPAVEPDAVNPRTDGMRVLVVDDNFDLVMMLAGTLRKKGYSVQQAYTGLDGLKIAQQWRPDVVLLDIGLPELDGYEVAKRLRSDPTLGNAGARMRLIALTGYGRDSDIALAIEAGFDAHLVKPYEFDELEKLMTAPSKPRSERKIGDRDDK